MTTKSGWPLLVIALAITGAGFSYHLTTQSRFAALEQKLDQNALALQQYQIAQETAVSAKTEALTNLGHEVDALQSSLAPLGKASQEQKDSLTEIRKQVSALDQLQQAQQDAQKKLDGDARQIEKIQHDVQLQAAAPPAITSPVISTAAGTIPSTSLTHSASASPVMASTIQASPPAVASDSASSVPSDPLPLAEPAKASPAAPRPAVLPRAGNAAVDIRPAAITAQREDAVRALPVALPVSPAFSDNR